MVVCLFSCFWARCWVIWFLMSWCISFSVLKFDMMFLPTCKMCKTCYLHDVFYWWCSGFRYDAFLVVCDFTVLHTFRSNIWFFDSNMCMSFFITTFINSAIFFGESLAFHRLILIFLFFSSEKSYFLLLHFRMLFADYFIDLALLLVLLLVSYIILLKTYSSRWNANADWLCNRLSFQMVIIISN